ncbi:hypothetical protein GCM10010912_10960 [Paenibacillus albidus]|uniref:ABC transporter permease n=1 Tax=Paenibacillus albidus TaxID=2041023 RepID=A0A917C349_9BACL|nr:ABC transporter permease [Paenibacillus albidus]GGF67765.1 hypothetical protein GCM10010912_10960 [Paenibacillus albidus]
MRNFNRLIVNEWLKMSRKKSFLIPFLIVLVLPLLVGYVSHTFSTQTPEPGGAFMKDSLLPSGIGQIVTILAVIGTAGMVAKEYSLGTIKFLLIRARSRTVILGSKYMTALLYGFTLTLVTLISGFTAEMIWFADGIQSLDVQMILMSLLYGLVYTAVYVTFGFMMGILTTSTGATIGITMFVIMLDKIMIFRDFYKYMLFPNMNLSVYQDGGAPLPGMTLSFSSIVLSVYTLLFLLISFTVFRRRDVA